MPAMTLPAEGGCLCGNIRFRISTAPMVTIACHCTGCQRMTASAFSLTAMIPEAGFARLTGSRCWARCIGPISTATIAGIA